jgi:uncharacterized protein (DUF4415 family)
MKARGEIFAPGPNAAARDIPDAFWESAEPYVPVSKASIHLRVDQEVLDWFKNQGPGHLTRMNAVLRSYYKAHQRPSSSKK